MVTVTRRSILRGVAAAATAAGQPERRQPGGLRVPAQAEWTDSGIDLLPGESCTVITANGRWSHAADPAPFYDYRGLPNNRTPGLKLPNRLGALIGQVGSGPVVYAGVDATVRATVRGMYPTTPASAQAMMLSEVSLTAKTTTLAPGPTPAACS